MLQHSGTSKQAPTGKNQDWSGHSWTYRGSLVNSFVPCRSQAIKRLQALAKDDKAASELPHRYLVSPDLSEHQWCLSSQLELSHCCAVARLSRAQQRRVAAQHTWCLQD